MAYTEIKCSEAIIENRFSAEYFDPKYSFVQNDKYQWEKIGRLLKVCQYGISISMNEDEKGYPIFRMNELENCFATIASKYANINQKEFQQFKINKNDILFNRTNSIDFVGRTGIVKEDTNSVFASYLVRLVPDNSILLPEFLAIYLNTKFGIGQIKRRAMPSINQANVSAAELKQILIPVIPLPIQKEISKIVNKSFDLKQLSQSLYTQARELLEHELGLDKLVFDKPVSYEARFSEVVENNRVDADYYQAAFRLLENHLSKISTKPLGEIVDFFKGIEVGSKQYTQTGIPFLRVSNIKEMGLNLGNSDKYISEKLYSALHNYKPRIGEILLTKDGTPGVCYTVTEETEGVISGGIMKLSLKDNSVPSEYLALVINSKICRMQIEQECSGALIVHWKPEAIRKLEIPLLPLKIMNQLNNLVSDSKKAKIESQSLLEQAKSCVEQLIEEAVQK